MELVRSILLRAEDAGYAELSSEAFAEDGFDSAVVAAHMQLLEEAGLIEANLLTLEGYGAVQGHVNRLTWAGHDYLDAIRNSGVWAKTKKLIVEKVGSAPLEVFKAVAVKLVLQQVGIS